MTKVLLVRSSPKPARVVKEAISLKNAGYAVKILFWDRSCNTSRSENQYDISIRYFGLKAPYGKTRLFPYLLVWWIYEFIYLLNSDADIFHGCCFDTLIPAMVVKLLKRKKLVYDIFDFYAEALPQRIPEWILRIIAGFERYCIRFTDAVIIVDESRRIQIDGSKIKKLGIIMNCPEMMPKREPRCRDAHLTIFYGGMISKTRGLDQIINAIKGEPDMALVVAGLGEDEEYYSSMFKDTENVHFLGWIDYEAYVQRTLEADVIFGFYDPRIPNNRLASPNKLFEAMMCATPIVVNKETTMADIVEEENCGIVVPYYDVDALKDALMWLKVNPSLCSKLGKNGRLAFEKKYNWEIMEKRLINLYAGLLNLPT